jgi:predicted permease
VFGLGLAWWASQFLLRVVVTDAATLPLDPTPSLRAFAFAAGITIATAALFGLVPALRATSRRRHSSARVPDVGRRRILERGLVAAQTAMSLVLLVFAALFVRSLQNLLALDPGYDRSQVLLFSVDAGLAGGRVEDARQRYLALLDALRAQPGVQSASVSAVAPVSTSYYFVSGLSKLGTVEFPEDQRLRIAFNVVTPGYFDTLRIPLLAGRDFTPQDRVGTQSVVIVSERLAAKFKGNPIGQLIGNGNDTQEVIGVARDNRYANVKDAPRDVTYSSMLQGDSIRFSPTYEIRYLGAAREAMDTVRRTIAATDPALTPFQMMTLDDRTRDSLARERLLAMISTYIGGFAVLLACIGLYGLLTYSVAQRTPELGLRMALGSEPRGVRRIVLAESLVTVAIGALAGLVAAWMLVGLARTQLHAMEPTDPIAFASALALLLAMAGIASYLPAWRASRINPVIALRRE